MATSQELYNQMQSLINQQNTMGTADPTKVYQDIASKVDYFKPQYQELAQMEKQAYQAPTQLMQGYQQAYGNEPGTGPSAMARLNAILGNIGQQYGTMGAMRSGIETAKGGLADIASSAVNQANLERQKLQDQYNMLSPLYSTALQQEEAQRAREEAARQAAAAAQLQQNYLNQLQQQWGGGQPTQTYSPTRTDFESEADLVRQQRGGMDSATFTANFNALKQQNQQYGLGYTDEEIWRLLGNVPSTPLRIETGLTQPGKTGYTGTPSTILPSGIQRALSSAKPVTKTNTQTGLTTLNKLLKK